MKKAPSGAFLCAFDSNLPQVRQNRRERFCIAACGDP
jgi:hypothetical protein